MKTKFKLCALALASALSFSGAIFAFTLIELMIVVAIIASLRTSATTLDYPRDVAISPTTMPDLVPSQPNFQFPSGFAGSAPLTYNKDHTFTLAFMNTETNTGTITDSSGTTTTVWKKLSGFKVTESVTYLPTTGLASTSSLTVGSTYSFYLDTPPVRTGSSPLLVGNKGIMDYLSLPPDAKAIFWISACNKVGDTPLCSDPVKTNEITVPQPTK